MTLGSRSDIDHFAFALRETGRFVYGNSYKLALISVGWFLCALPLVTIGPATLAAYTAISQLESDRNTLDFPAIADVVRRQFVPAFLFGLVPPSFFVLSGFYLVAQASAPSLVRTGLFYLTLYLALYASLVMIPTFWGLVAGYSPAKAIVGGVRWTAKHPTLAMLAGIATLVVLVLTLLLTIGFVLLFPTLAFSFHAKLVDIDEVVDA